MTDPRRYLAFIMATLLLLRAIIAMFTTGTGSLEIMIATGISMILFNVAVPVERKL